MVEQCCTHVILILSGGPQVVTQDLCTSQGLGTSVGASVGTSVAPAASPASFASPLALGLTRSARVFPVESQRDGKLHRKLCGKRPLSSVSG